MGLPSRRPRDARRGADPRGPDDRRAARPCHAGRGRAPDGLTAAPAALVVALAALALALPARAETLRLATWGAALSREGPGLLLRDVLAGDDPQVEAVAAVLAEVRPDVLLLTEMDWDGDGAALAALADALALRGLDYPHRLALMPNAGMPTGLDLDANGRLGEARDAMGYGRFAGDGGLALLSRHPLGAVTDLTRLPWRDLPGARLPVRDGRPFPSEEAWAARRLSSTGHWAVTVEAPGGPLTVLAFAATPPVFDGPEDANGLRGADELALWSRVMDGAVPGLPEATAFAVMGNANLDPADGQGLRGDMVAFLADPRLRDPRPMSAGGRLAADAGQRGDPALDTADWPGAEAEEGGPGNLRVSYVLPSADWGIAGAGVFWPAPGDPLAALLGEDGLAAGPHRLVWADVTR